MKKKKLFFFKILKFLIKSYGMYQSQLMWTSRCSGEALLSEVHSNLWGSDKCGNQIHLLSFIAYVVSVQWLYLYYEMDILYTYAEWADSALKITQMAFSCLGSPSDMQNIMWP